MRIFIVLLTALVLAVPVRAEDIKEVVSSGPSWDTFTNKDGSGLYHEVLRDVFALYGVTVRHEYVPTDRGDQLVREGAADMMTCDDSAASLLQLAKYPLYVNDYFVFFKKKRIGEWHNPESLRDKVVVCQLGYYHDWDFPVPVQLRNMSSGAKCLNMILFDRADFYVDDMSFINKSIDDTDQQFNREEYDIQRIGTRSYHPVFSTTSRAKKIMKMYDDGIMTLHKAGKLKPIYDKWGHAYPEFDKF